MQLTIHVPDDLIEAAKDKLPPPEMGVLEGPQSPHKQVAVQLHNVTDRTIVAYSLETEGFDARGNKIGDFRREFDYAGPEPNLCRVNFIPSGRIATAHYTTPESQIPAS